MSVPTGLPAPAANLTRAGIMDAAGDVAGTDIVVAVGDFTGGAADDMFTLTSHGLVTGDYLWLLHKTAAGVVNGVLGSRFRAKVLSSSTFQLTSAGTVVEHSADGTAVFLKGSHTTSDAMVQTVILPNLIVAEGDFTGGATDDMFTPSAALGLHGLEDTNTLKLLYKAAAGVVTGIAAGTTVFAKSVTTTAFELAATSGGADIENSADGTAIFLKTS